MKHPTTKKNKPLSTFDCLNLISVASAVCSTVLVYLMLLGPMLIVIPWLLFYQFKQKSPYFFGWTWSRVIVVSVVGYALGLGLGTLCLYTLIVNESLIASGALAGLLICDLIYGVIVCGTRIFLRA